MHPHFERDPVGRASAPTQELESKFWRENAQDHLRKLVAANARGTAKNAKNIILFLGDGMSLTTVAAARMYLGAEQESLSFEKFQHFGLSKVSLSIAGAAEKVFLIFLFSFEDILRRRSSGRLCVLRHGISLRCEGEHNDDGFECKDPTGQL